MRRLTLFIAAALFGITASANAQGTLYDDQSSFESALGNSFTDTYTNSAYYTTPGYGDGNGSTFNILTNAEMDAVMGETTYVTTAFQNWDILDNDSYCAGCNGSFILGFTSTTVGTSQGVFGVGFSVLSDYGIDALVTFGDGSTEDFALSSQTYFGITSTEDIASIYFGVDGQSSYNDIDISNLTIGSSGAVVPEPASLALLGFSIAGLGAIRRRKAKAA